MDAISIWQDTTQQTIKELSTNVTKLPEEVSVSVCLHCIIGYTSKSIHKHIFKFELKHNCIIALKLAHNRIFIIGFKLAEEL